MILVTQALSLEMQLLAEETGLEYQELCHFQTMNFSLSEEGNWMQG